MEKHLIKPYAVMSKVYNKCDVFIDGPIEDILVADFNFDKDHIKIYGTVTSHLLYQLYNLYHSIDQDVNRVKKEVDDES